MSLDTIWGSTLQDVPSRNVGSLLLSAPTANNTSASITLAAPAAGQANCIAMVTFSYSATPTGGRVYVTNDSTTIFNHYITQGGPGPITMSEAIRMTPATSSQIVLTAGGVGTSGSVSCVAWVESI